MYFEIGNIQELFLGRNGIFLSALMRVATSEQQHTLLKLPTGCLVDITGVLGVLLSGKGN